MMNSDYIQASRHLFTSLLCWEIQWAILLDQREMFSCPLHPVDFTTGDTPHFPMSSLKDIGPHLHYQTNLNRANFPQQWKPQQQQQHKTQATILPPPHQQMVIPPPVPSGASPFIPLPPPSNPGLTSHLPPNPPPPPPPKFFKIHPAIKTTMMTYLNKFGPVQLNQLLLAVNKPIKDLPTLPKYMKNGRSTSCYNTVLGCCIHKYVIKKLVTLHRMR